MVCVCCRRRHRTRSPNRCVCAPQYDFVHTKLSSLIDRARFGSFTRAYVFEIAAETMKMSSTAAHTFSNLCQLFLFQKALALVYIVVYFIFFDISSFSFCVQIVIFLFLFCKLYSVVLCCAVLLYLHVVVGCCSVCLNSFCE